LSLPAPFPAPIGPWAVGPVAWVFLLLALFIPWSAWRSRSRVLQLPAWPSRSRRFVTGLFVQLWFVAMALMVASRLGITLFVARAPSVLQIMAAAAVVAVLVALMAPLWRRAVEKRSWRAYFFMPRTGAERALWSVNAVAAGVCEEIFYRGVLTAVLGGVLHSALAGAAASAALFGLAHAFQSRVSMAIIVGIAAAMQALTWWSGALWLAMAAHTAYDLVAGFSYGRLGERLGYPTGGIPLDEARAQPSR
jgi:membrane protease YdiL (CAAX protease family)